MAINFLVSSAYRLMKKSKHAIVLMARTGNLVIEATTLLNLKKKEVKMAKKNGKSNGKKSTLLTLTPEVVLEERKKWKEIGDSVHRQLVVEDLDYILKQLSKKGNR